MCGFQCRYGLLARDAPEIVEELVETVIPFEVIDQVPQRRPRADENGRPAQNFRVAVNNRRELHDRPPHRPLYGVASVEATRSSGVVKDDAERKAVAGAERADAVPHGYAVVAARAGDRTVIDREQHRVTLVERHHLAL